MNGLQLLVEPSQQLNERVDAILNVSPSTELKCGYTAARRNDHPFTRCVIADALEHATGST